MTPAELQKIKDRAERVTDWHIERPNLVQKLAETDIPALLLHIEGDQKTIAEMDARIAELLAALAFYADPFAAQLDEPIPDFYRELDFGETARAVLGWCPIETAPTDQIIAAKIWHGNIQRIVQARWASASNAWIDIRVGSCVGWVKGHSKPAFWRSEIALSKDKPE